MIRRQLHLLAPVLFTLLPAIAACPVPIGHTETASQPVSGTYRRSDGAPIANAWVRLSIDGRDTSCMHYVLTTRTDSAGHFQFPGTHKHYKIFWFVPNLDRVDPAYSVCLEQGNGVKVAYDGRGSLTNDVVPEAISCVQWDRGSGPETSCSGFFERNVATGGEWKTDDGVGWYRVLLSRSDNPWSERPRIVLQWMEGNPAGRDSVVRAAELPFDHRVWAVYDPEIFQEDGRWYLTFDALRHALLDDTKSSHVRFRLGPPGEAPTVQPY
ncbi:MAG TPA: carboxypeptidase-like regulatory domain-containing protein [Gemmatimonadales bacterium]|nr:carboxypeptidase-like regulatory domain-containing protein [Gemmatimonadales bacterium]